MPVNILASFSDFIFPRTCAVCGRPCDRPSRHVCSTCLNRIAFVPFRGCCRVCGRDVAGFDGEYLCEDCRTRSTAPGFDQAASAVRFDGFARDLILDYKFNRAFHLVGDFVDWMEAALYARYDVPAIDVVLPVPTTAVHRWDRGYDQTSYLARVLAKRIDRVCGDGFLGRAGSPRRQGGLDEESRRENVKGTFVVAKSGLLRGRTVLLVDDIMTTGSTLSEAASVVRAAGAAVIWCVTIARSVRD